MCISVKSNKLECFKRNLIINDSQKSSNKVVVQFFFSNNLLDIYSKEEIERYNNINKLIKMYDLSVNKIDINHLEKIKQINNIEVEKNESIEFVNLKNEFFKELYKYILEPLNKKHLNILFSCEKFISFEIDKSDIDYSISEMCNSFYSKLDILINSFMNSDIYYIIEFKFKHGSKSSSLSVSFTNERAKITISNKNKILDEIVLRNTLNRLNSLSDIYTRKITGKDCFYLYSSMKPRNNLFSKLNKALYIGLTNESN